MFCAIFKTMINIASLGYGYTSGIFEFAILCLMVQQIKVSKNSIFMVSIFCLLLCYGYF